MQKFQDLLAQAAQLKQSQLKKQRKNYESLPQYLKTGLNYAKKYQYLRKQDYIVQMNVSQKLKKQGNKLFNASLFKEALSKYQQALAIFRFINAKTYDNMKDQDMIYQLYSLPEPSKEYLDQYEKHMMALYLNISSCLTKMNKKEDAIHSADEALKIKETAKAFYKKAHAYLKFINRETPDIKLGFYYLNKSYQLSKDSSIIEEMHKIKKQIDEQQDKQKKWFKFMFDKNSKSQQPIKQINNNKAQQHTKNQQQPKRRPQTIKSQGLKNFESEQKDTFERQDQKLQKTKQKLSKFTLLSYGQQQWLQMYEGQFILKHGSKIYSIIQIYGYKQYLGQYKSLLAQCLQSKRQEKYSQKRKQIYNKYFQWLKNHPIDKIQKYTERYHLQVKWIQQERNVKRSLLNKNHQLQRQSIQMQKKVGLYNKEGQNYRKDRVVEENKQENISQANQDIKNIQETLDNISKFSQSDSSLHHQVQASSNYTTKQIDKKLQQTNSNIRQETPKILIENIQQKNNFRFKYYSIAIAAFMFIVLKLLY